MILLIISIFILIIQMKINKYIGFALMLLLSFIIQIVNNDYSFRLFIVVLIVFYISISCYSSLKEKKKILITMITIYIMIIISFYSYIHYRVSSIINLDKTNTEELFNNYEEYKEIYIDGNINVDEYISNLRIENDNYLRSNIGNSEIKVSQLIKDITNGVVNQHYETIEQDIIELINSNSQVEVINTLNEVEEEMNYICMIMYVRYPEKYDIAREIDEDMKKIEEMMYSRYGNKKISSISQEYSLEATINYDNGTSENICVDIYDESDYYKSYGCRKEESLKSKEENYIYQNAIMDIDDGYNTLANKIYTERTINTNWEINYKTYITLYECEKMSVIEEESIGKIRNKEMDSEELKNWLNENVQNPYTDTYMDRNIVIMQVSQNEK